MKSLLDTQLLLWAMAKPSRLPSEVRDLIENTSNEVVFSAASIWEVAIKSGLSKTGFSVDAALLRRALIDNGYTELPVSTLHAVGVVNLPPIHKDPFDRLLVAQATAEGIWLITTDHLIARYPGPIRKVG